MTPLTWPCPLPGGGVAREYAFTFNRSRAKRLLIVPALFDEANRLRRLTVETMRRLDRAGIDAFLPDFPGTNESPQSLAVQQPDCWLEAITAAARHFEASHVLGIRGGCLFTPAELPTLHYAPVKAENLVRQMFRARILASREAGREETRDGLIEMAEKSGIELAGHRIGAGFIRQFETSIARAEVKEISQDEIGGAGLWLRAEPGESDIQADTLAAIVTKTIG